jgi:hypothetical protein
MRQADVARATRVGGVQPLQVVVQRIAVLDADHRGEPPRRLVRPDVARRARQPDLVRVTLQHEIDGVVLTRGLRDGLGVTRRGQRPLLDIDDEEGGVQSTATHLRQVHLERTVLAGVELRVVHVRQGDVDMGVEGQRMVLCLRGGAEQQGQAESSFHLPPVEKRCLRHQKSIETVNCPKRGGWKRIGWR